VKQIFGPGFVMLDESPFQNRCDFWFLQSNPHGRVLLNSRNTITKRRLLGLWWSRMRAAG
jgi:hypothetical protein